MAEIIPASSQLTHDQILQYGDKLNESGNTTKSKEIHVHWGENNEIKLEEDEDCSDYDDIVDELEEESGDFTKKLNAARMSYPQVNAINFSRL